MCENAYGVSKTLRGMATRTFGRGMPLRGVARNNPRKVFEYGRGRGERSKRVPEPEGWGLTQEMYSSSSFSSSNRFAMLFT